MCQKSVQANHHRPGSRVFHDWRREVIFRQNRGVSKAVDGYERRGVVDRTKSVQDGRWEIPGCVLWTEMIGPYLLR